jgi:hypothetical protein
VSYGAGSGGLQEPGELGIYRKVCLKEFNTKHCQFLKMCGLFHFIFSDI